MPLVPLLASIETPGPDENVCQGQPLLVSGWALAEAGLQEISFWVGEEQIATAALGCPRPDIAAAHPEYQNSLLSGFEAKLFLPRPGVAEIIAKFCSRGGIVSIERRAVTVLPAAASGTTALRQLWRTLPPIQVSIDRVVIDAQNILKVEGWAASLAPLERVEILIGDALLGNALVGQPRVDVEREHPEYIDSERAGFVFRTDAARLQFADQLVRARAHAVGGSVQENCAPIAVLPRGGRQLPPDEKIHLRCEEARLTRAGVLWLKGWVTSRSGIVSFVAQFNDEPAQRVGVGIERNDVGNHFPRIPGARRAGFEFRRKCKILGSGDQLLVLTAQNGRGETLEQPIPLPRPEEPDDRTADSGDAQFNIDKPKLVEGVVRERVQSALTIEGWALGAHPITRIEVHIDGRCLGQAYRGIRREDVAAKFPDRPGALLCGFAFAVPPVALTRGEHVFEVLFHDADGVVGSRSFRAVVARGRSGAGEERLCRRMPRAESTLQTAVLEAANWLPNYTVLVRIGRPAEAELRRAAITLASLAAQAYPHWRAGVLVPEDATAAVMARLRRDLPELAGRLDAVAPDAPVPLEAVLPPVSRRPTFLTILAAGDRLGADALLAFAVESSLDRDADLLYADERRIDPATGESAVYHKPQWSPDLLLATNYIGRPWAAAAALVERTGARLDELGRCGEFDLVLRLTEQAAAIRSLPKLLAERGRRALDPPQLERAALRRALARRGLAGEVAPGCLPGVWRCRHAVTTSGLVSIVILTAGVRGLVRTAIETIRLHTAYPHYEIVCVDNIPAKEAVLKQWVRDNADRTLELAAPFNWSHFNNRAAEIAAGEFLLFLNDDVEVTDPDWLHGLLEHAQHPEIAAVGARLLYPDGKVQHAGMYLAATGGRHAFRFASADDPGPFGLARTERTVIGVTGACMLVRRDAFAALGGFDEAHDVINNDLDFCLRLRRGGRRVIYTPHVTLVHHEMASRSAVADRYDRRRFAAAWHGIFALGGPYSHPRLSTERDDFAPEPEPAELVFAGPALAPAEQIRRILAIKLDHIGDFVTAFPALRALKHAFPAAELTVLCPHVSAAIAELEPAIDRVIEFEFFHGRSSRGRRATAAEELAALRARLVEQSFDVALDLRKHPDTRTMLTLTGARLLAGFDHRGRFPWLDFALEWEGDPAGFPKRGHVADDLVRLVDALRRACEQPQAPPPLGAPAEARTAARALPGLLAFGERLFARATVCVAPGVGSPMRQWPARHFATLIDLLIEHEDVDVVVIGGPGEARIVDAVIEGVRRRERLVSLVGQTRLNDLPVLLRACALFVGNNSGPKHIAALLGVPTLGVHSGVVDAREWGPLGPYAGAIRRRMTCGPCYLARKSDCHRGLACLEGLAPADVYRACRPLLAIGRARMAVPAAGPTTEHPFHLAAG